MKGSAIITRMGLCAAMVCSLVLAIALPTMVEPLNAGGRKPPSYPLKIEVLGGGGTNPIVVPMSGWVLSIALETQDEPAGIVTRARPPRFPWLTIPSTIANGAFIVFDDPDECPSMSNPDCPSPYSDGCAANYYINPGCGAGVDESFLEFIPGADPPLVGAATGFTQRLPGLVVLCDTGIGNGYTLEGSLASPRVAFNLAANVGSVGYLFRDSKNNPPIVVATITAPNNMMVAKVEVDRNIGGEQTCTTVGSNTDCTCDPADTGTIKYRIDGGPVTTSGWLDVFDPILNVKEVTCRIFVVKAMNGPNPPVTLQPPLFIVDTDNNNVVSAEDAVRMGYELIAGEKIVRFRVFYDYFTGESKDFDGNGCTGGVVLPASPGGITRVPH